MTYAGHGCLHNTITRAAYKGKEHGERRAGAPGGRHRLGVSEDELTERREGRVDHLTRR